MTIRDEVDFWILGVPRPWPRPRARAVKTPKGYQARIYKGANSGASRKHYKHWAETCRVEMARNKQEVRNLISPRSPISLSLTFVMPRPKDHYTNRDRSRPIKDSAPIAHISNPDVDNLAKCILDEGNELLWDDDRQVAQLVLTKHYTTDSRCGCHVIVRPLKFEHPNEEPLYAS
jgi:Holliday junction resolvase RusA-like endonuclease